MKIINQETELRKQINQAEFDEQTTKYPDLKIFAHALAVQLKAKLNQLKFPPLEEL